MSVRRNLSAGVANSIWTALASFIAVPFYLKFLGSEAYGLIGFFTTTQTLLQVLDLGLTTTLNREVALSLAQNKKTEAANTLHTVASAYWAIAALIIVVLVGGSGAITHHWLHPQGLSTDSVDYALKLMAVVIALRWPVAIYQGVLLGAQKLSTQSYINMIMTTFASAGAVLILAFVSRTISAFFIWQAGAAFINVMTNRYVAWRTLGGKVRMPFDKNVIRRIWRFSAGMNGVAISGLLLANLDKIVLSKTLSLKDFGYYMLAVQVSSCLYLLLSPVFNTIYPKLTNMVAHNDMSGIAQFYRTGTRLLLALVFPLAMIVGFFAKDLVFLWTRDLVVAEAVAPLVLWYILGTSFNGVMHFPYALQLAFGYVRIPFKINFILVVFMLPMILYSSLKLGAVGGSLTWTLLNFIYIFLGTYLTHKEILKNLGATWLTVDVLAPLGLSAILVYPAAFYLKSFGCSSPINVAFAVILGIVCVVVSLLVSPSTKEAVKRGLFAFN